MITKTESRHEKTKERVSKDVNRSKAWRRRRVTSRTKTI